MNLTMAQDKLREECGVAGVSLNKPISAGIVYNALLALQHRGQEGAGIAVVEGRTITCHKGEGLVGEIFDAKCLAKLPASSLAIGHNRYSTTGTTAFCNVQPFVTEYLTGRHALAHNGNITNSKALRNYLENAGVDFKASSDSEVISALIALNTVRLGDIVSAVIAAAKMLEGAYCLVIAYSDGRLIAIRDPQGFRPLCIGRNENGILISSESCALDSCGFEFIRDIQPGEIVVIKDGQILMESSIMQSPTKGLCIFEYVYFARPDSVIDSQSVYEARVNMGIELAKEHPVQADVVCGVPDSGLEAAAGYARQSNIPLVSGFVKNRYIGRSFIFPTQSQRENAVRLKLNPLEASIKGKSVVLIDDSIVRGTTAKKIISALKAAGAKQVHMCVSAPPFIHTCHYGTDIDSEENLLANHMNVEQICKKIGADSLGFISVEGLKKACKNCNLNMCTGCFNGDYPVLETVLSKHELEK